MSETDNIVPVGPIFVPGGNREVDVAPAGPIKTPEPEGWISGGARTIASGLTGGAAVLAGAPRALSDVAAWGLNKVGVPEEYTKELPFSDAPSYSDLTNAMAGWTGGYTDYDPTTLGGRASKNTLTFVPSAVLATMTAGTSLVPTMTAGAVVPGVAGETAKDAAEWLGERIGSSDPKALGEKAKLAAELISPFAASRVIPSAGRVLQDPALSTAAEQLGKLEKFGVTLTPEAYRRAGDLALSATKNSLSNPNIAKIVTRQPEQFSRGILNSVGINDDVARSVGYLEGLNPLNVGDVVGKVSSEIGAQIGDAYKLINIRSVPSHEYRHINWLIDKKLPNGAFSPYMPGTDYGKWLHNVRQQAQELLMKGDKSFSQHAEDAVNTIDSIMMKSVTPDYFAYLQSLNEKYSRLSAVQDALSTTGSKGVVTPQAMMNVPSNRHTKDLSEISDIADTYLLQRGVALTSENKRNVMKYLLDAAGGIGGALPMLQFGASPITIAKAVLTGSIGAGAMHGAQKAYHAYRASRPGRYVDKTHALYGTPTAGIVAPSALGAITDTREGRKSGGRVDASHEKLADQLVMAAERAKKGISKGTESLLDMSDNHIAHALEVANRSI